MAVLDRWLAGSPAEQALTNWARASRFAGSADRLAVRDLVFDAIRCRRSFAAASGAETGRGLILGGLRLAGADPAAVFTGEGHAPPRLTEAEVPVPPPPEGLAALDCPDWLAPALQDSLGPDFAAVMQRLRHRAPVFLRVHAGRATLPQAIAALAAEGVAAAPHPLANFVLEVSGGARKIQSTRAYAEGVVEVQDAASQAVVQALPLRPGMRVLDLCAGGGGKTLAMAAAADLTLFAHDAEPRRMADLPVRAARAGAVVRLLDRPEDAAPFDLVLADAPCSGSGAWRRSPEGKWALTPERLAALVATQGAILDRAAALVAPGGVLAYATCSLLAAENGGQVAAFLGRAPGFRAARDLRLTPLDGGDGFFLALMVRAH
jgi:16S rRNA (cytosine967-C5)-methyltransferase